MKSLSFLVALATVVAFASCKPCPFPGKSMIGGYPGETYVGHPAKLFEGVFTAKGAIAESLGGVVYRGDSMTVRALLCRGSKEGNISSLTYLLEPTAAGAILEHLLAKYQLMYENHKKNDNTFLVQSCGSYNTLAYLGPSVLFVVGTQRSLKNANWMKIHQSLRNYALEDARELGHWCFEHPVVRKK